MNLFDQNQAIAEALEQILVTSCAVKGLALPLTVGGEAIQDRSQTFESFARENDPELSRIDVACYRWHGKVNLLAPLARDLSARSTRRVISSAAITSPAGHPPPSSRGRASFTVKARPFQSLPFSAAMAALAASSVFIVAKAKPRARPVSRSITTLISLTGPCWPSRSRRSVSVVLKDRFPTYNLVLIIFAALAVC